MKNSKWKQTKFSAYISPKFCIWGRNCSLRLWTWQHDHKRTAWGMEKNVHVCIFEATLRSHSDEREKVTGLWPHAWLDRVSMMLRPPASKTPTWPKLLLNYAMCQNSQKCFFLLNFYLHEWIIKAGWKCGTLREAARKPAEMFVLPCWPSTPNGEALTWATNTFFITRTR